MNRTILTDEQLMGIWEDQREIKNLMGRYTRALLHKEEETILELFWSRRQDVCLGLNEGWYLGRESVGGYYAYLAEKANWADACIKARFHGVPEIQNARGIGQLEMKALSSDLLEIAGDGETAKGMWNCAGQMPEFTASGPVTHLTYGTYLVDFVRESEGWRIWHMQYLEEIKHPQGEKWWEPERQRPQLPEFAAMKEIKMPQPDVKTGLWEKYAPGRCLRKLPPLPEPYETFAKTFSYGFSGEVKEA